MRRQHLTQFSVIERILAGKVEEPRERARSPACSDPANADKSATQKYTICFAMAL